MNINNDLKDNTLKLIDEFDEIDATRKAQLEELGDFMLNKTNNDEKFKALFACTHNSRRSHFADLWFKYALMYYGVNSFESYSGGTKATAFNDNAIDAIKRVGFSVVYDKQSYNPVVSISPGDLPVWNMQSKVYTHKINPKSNFVAIMVCSDADKSCPMVDGAIGRFAIPYNDPRYFDNTPAMQQKYDETIYAIGREMLYLIHYVKNKLILTAENQN